MWPSFTRAEQVQPIIKLLQGVLTALATFFNSGEQWPPQALVCDGASYDFVVVGAGTAGSIVASRLSEHPDVRVLLIEAGGDPPIASTIPGLFSLIPGSDNDWNYKVVNDGYASQAQKDSISYTRGKMLGGSGSANYMLQVRGHPEDYDSWAASFQQGWDYQNVLKYFLKSENVKDKVLLEAPTSKYRGHHGNIDIIRQVHRNETIRFFAAFHELGNKFNLDYNAGLELGYSEGQYANADGVRHSTARAYLAPNNNRTNLDVLKHTHVTKVIFDNSLNAVAVEAIAKNGTILKIRASKEIILSAGSINTPHILMLSGVGAKGQLLKLNISTVIDLPVGENLQDHVMVPVLLTTEEGPARPDPTTLYEFPLPTMMNFVSLNITQKRPAYELMSFPVNAGSKQPLLLCTSFGYRDEICNRFNDAIKNKSSFIGLIVLLHPRSRGYIRPRNKNPKTSPIINLGFYTDNRDLEEHVTYIEDVLRIQDTSFGKRVGMEPVDPKLPECANVKFGSREYWRCYALNLATTVYHPCGSTPMGKVLDARLRLRHSRRLRVVDAGAMPWITSGNINAPVAMIAERAADLIKQEHGLSAPEDC